MKIKVLKTDGSESGREVQLDDAIFGTEPNKFVMFEDVRSYLANQRRGTASTKGRSEVRGGGRKAYRQKGTGMARRGSIRSPLLKGGGTSFGPKPRDYKVGITKKMKSLARKSSLTYKAQENAIVVVEDFDFETPKTKSINDIINALKIDGKKVLLLTDGNKPAVYKSGRNLPGVTVMEGSNPSTYHIMHSDVVLLQEGAVKQLEESINRKAEEVQA
ncbi:50S ribosomal protein L4 [Balneolales bacterium ANBcel1]|nr:50S ribosomal protein L4 [Balneolales bacterium ANBcel1]